MRTVKLIGLLVCLALLGGLTAPAQAHATLNEVTAVNRYTGNGSTTAFAYGFRVLVKGDLLVMVDTTVKAVDTDYTVSGLGASGGGTVTFFSAPADGTVITLLRKQPVEQLSDYVPNETFPAERLEKDLDKLGMIAQQHKEALDRAVLLPKTSTLTGIQLPVPGADKYIKWNAAGTQLEAATAGGGAGGGLPSDPAACPSGQYATDQNEVGTLTCAQPSFSQLSGTATDAQIPNTITVDLATLATTATALAANGANCTAGEAAAGVDASGAAEGCFVPTVSTHNALSATHPDTLAASPVLGDLLHGNVTPKWARLAGNITTTKKFLNQTGDGAISAVPSWDALADADIPNTITIDLAATATALAANGANCTAGQYAAGVDASGVAEGCTALAISARSISTTLPLAGGGDLSADRTLTCTTCTTNAAALTIDQVVVGGGGQATKILPAGAAADVLTMTGGIPTWSAPSVATGHAILSATHTDSAAGAVVLGGIIYGNVTPAWAQLAGNITATKKFLTQTGTGAVSAAPAWDTIVAGDLPAGFVDATTDLAAGLCTDTQILKKAAGVWGCAADASTTGITSLGVSGSPQTGATQLLALVSTGTDVSLTSSGDTHTLAIPSASATARGLVTTGAQNFAGAKTFTSTIISSGATPDAISIGAASGTAGVTMSGNASPWLVSVSGTFTSGLVLGGATYTTAAILQNNGTTLGPVWGATRAGGWEVNRGTSASADTTAGPLVKISRYEAIPITSCNSTPADQQCNAALVVHSYGTAASRMQQTAILGVSRGVTNATTAGQGDVTAVQGWATGEVGHTRALVGGYFQARRGGDGAASANTAVNTIGAELRTDNNTTQSCTYETSGASACTGLWITHWNVPNTAGLTGGSAIQVGGVTSNSQYQVGLGFVGVGGVNSICTTSGCRAIDDASNSHTSYYVQGSHTYGIDLTAATFSSLAYRDMPGTVQSGFGGTTYAGKRMEIAVGTAASPVTTAGALLRISKTENITTATCGGTSFHANCNSAVAVYSVGTAADQMAPYGGVFVADGYNGHGAVGIVGVGNAVTGGGAGDGPATGVNAIATRQVSTAVAVIALETASHNSSGVDCGEPRGAFCSMGAFIAATGNAKNGAGITFNAASAATSWHTGILFKNSDSAVQPISGIGIDYFNASMTKGMDFGTGTFTTAIHMADATMTSAALALPGTTTGNAGRIYWGSGSMTMRTSDNAVVINNAAGCVKFVPNGAATTFAAC